MLPPAGSRPAAMTPSGGNYTNAEMLEVSVGRRRLTRGLRACQRKKNTLHSESLVLGEHQNGSSCSLRCPEAVLAVHSDAHDRRCNHLRKCRANYRLLDKETGWTPESGVVVNPRIRKTCTMPILIPEDKRLKSRLAETGDAMIQLVGDEQRSARIECQAVGGIKLLVRIAICRLPYHQSTSPESGSHLTIRFRARSVKYAEYPKLTCYPFQTKRFKGGIQVESQMPRFT
jgi:hypothetical protein